MRETPRARGRVFATVRAQLRSTVSTTALKIGRVTKEMTSNLAPPGTTRTGFGFFGVAVTQADKRSRLQF